MIERTITDAVGIIHGAIAKKGVEPSPERQSTLQTAFAAVDQQPAETEADGLALLALSNLILKDLVAYIDPAALANDGKMQLLAFAFAYQGRAIESLEMAAKRRALKAGKLEI